jgi:hypothetical protein
VVVGDDYGLHLRGIIYLNGRGVIM